MADDEAVPVKEMYLTSRTTFVVEYNHPSNWDVTAKADQVFNAGKREANQALEHLLMNHGERRYRIISSETSIVVGRIKKV